MNVTARRFRRVAGRGAPARSGDGSQPNWDPTSSRGSQRTAPAARTAQQLAPFLGGVSLGLGLPGVATPGAFSRLIGVDDNARNRALVRLVGVREIAAGVGVLTQRRPVGWLWTRVAGDAMDISLLLAALRSVQDRRQDRVAVALAAVLGITALDVFCALRLGQQSSRRREQDVETRKAITIKRTPQEVYQFWRAFQNLPRFMRHLESVQVIDDRRSRWKAQASAGTSVTWDAEIVEDRPNEHIAWRSLPGADVRNAGQVEFRPAPGGRGTEVIVRLRYDAPGGALGRTVARLLGKEPGQEVASDLRRLKQVLETGEIIQSDATVERPGLPQRPAQPPERAPRLAAAAR